MSRTFTSRCPRGLQIDSRTLWDQLDVMAGVLQPTYDALVRHVLAAEVVGADETWWRLMDRKGSKRWWVWSVTRERERLCLARQPVYKGTKAWEPKPQNCERVAEEARQEDPESMGRSEEEYGRPNPGAPPP